MDLRVFIFMSLKSGAKQMKDSIRKSIYLVVPPCLQGMLLNSLDDEASSAVPSGSTTRLNELGVDLALCLLRQKAAFGNTLDVVRFVWCDASQTRRGWDWMWAQVHEVARP